MAEKTSARGAVLNCIATETTVKVEFQQSKINPRYSQMSASGHPHRLLVLTHLSPYRLPLRGKTEIIFYVGRGRKGKRNRESREQKSEWREELGGLTGGKRKSGPQAVGGRGLGLQCR